VSASDGESRSRLLQEKRESLNQVFSDPNDLAAKLGSGGRDCKSQRRNLRDVVGYYRIQSVQNPLEPREINVRGVWLDDLFRKPCLSIFVGAQFLGEVEHRRALGPRKIRVNTVVPTWMWGPPVQMYVQWQVADRGITEDEAIGEITANMPLGEIPADEDVAESAIFLCSDRARMITGQTLYVNSGEYMT